MRSGGVISRYTPVKGCSTPSAPRLTKRQVPPGRKSMSHDVSSVPRGPHHCRMYSGFDMASNTSFRGASNSRTSLIVVSVGSVTLRVLVFAAIALLLVFELAQQVIEPFVALVPRTPEWFEPCVHLPQRHGVDGVEAPGPRGPHVRKAAFTEHA